MKSLRFVSISVCLLCLAPLSFGQGLLHGIAAIGDSMTDEYQEATDTQTAYNWLEQLAEYRSLNFGDVTNGITYEYNFAHRGDETDDLSSQVSDMIGYVTSGDVTLVCMMIGNNDLGKQYHPDQNPADAWYPNYYRLYEGLDSWQDKVNVMITRVASAIDEILEENTTVKMVVATAPDCELNPWYKNHPAFDDESKRQRIRDAFAEYKRKLVEEVIPNSHDPNRIAVADVYQLSLDWITKREAQENVHVGGYEINLEGISNDPDSIIVGDKIHPNTIPQGLIANQFIEAMNELDENLNLPLFSEQEILDHAGVPEPATCMLLMLGAGMFFRRKRG